MLLSGSWPRPAECFPIPPITTSPIRAAGDSAEGIELWCGSTAQHRTLSFKERWTQQHAGFRSCPTILSCLEVRSGR